MTLTESVSGCPFCAKSRLMQCSIYRLFDHLIGTYEQRRWYVEPKRFGCLEVDDSFVLGRRLYRKLSRFCAAQDTIDVGRGVLKHVNVVNSVGHKAAF